MARRVAKIAAVLVTLFALLGALPMPFSPAALAGTSAGADHTGPAGGRRVVLLGMPGLIWSDITETGTPALWRLTAQGSAAALSVRTTTVTTCSVEGWLTISAGQRARLAHGDCALPPAPATIPGDPAATAPGWAAIRKDNAQTSYQAEVGLLGDAVHRAKGCTMAVGPGGVFGAADRNGRVDLYAPSIDRVPTGDWSRCGFTAVDIDDVFRSFVTAGTDAKGTQVPVTLKQRATAVSAADRRVAQVLAAIPAGTTVLVAGLSDSASTPHLHVALRNGGPGYLTANSTRRPGLVTLTDVTSTALKGLGLAQPPKAIGSAWRTHASGTSPGAKIRTLEDEDVAAQAVSRMGGMFFVMLFGGQLLLYGIAAVALRRRWGGGASRRRILAGTHVVALMGAAAPVATFLANLIPWWRSAHPAPALLGCVLLAVVVVTALALAGPWRRSLTGPGLVLAGLTATVIGLDVITGSNLQVNAFMGYSPLVAGRFYGFGNMAFAVFAAAAILSAAWLAERPLRAGRRGLAVAVAVTIGLVAAAIDGWPGWGADFGGVLALIPATAVLGMLIAGKRVSAARLGLFCLTAVAAVLALSFTDSLRPASQETHLGRFWDQLGNGEALGVVTRKAGAMVHSLGYWPFTVIAIASLCFLYFVLSRPLDWRAALLDRAYSYSSTLRPALLSALTLAIIGMVMNDSGVVIPALVFSVAVPLALAACVRALEQDEDLADTPTPVPAEPRSAPTG
ncbi:MAG: hypothetical protein JWL58_5472 [Streptosporangiaceae bacterium]|nr:hypothetical protein [Streptosporangiaceae bacterium]